MENKINKNVGLWLALNKDNKLVTIDKATNGVDYYCAECGSIVHSRALNSECVSPHFYHLNKGNCSCNEVILQYWKENLINIGETINLPTIGDITCIDRRIDFKFDKYKVDLIIKTDNNEHRFIIFELKTIDSDYIDTHYSTWKKLKYDVFNIDIKKLIHNEVMMVSSIETIYSLNILNKQYETYLFINNKIKKLFINKDIHKFNNKYYKLDNEQIKHFKTLSTSILKPLKDFVITNCSNDIKSLSVIDKSVFGIEWNKQFYFDIIKPIHNKLYEFILYLKDME